MHILVKKTRQMWDLEDGCAMIISLSKDFTFFVVMVINTSVGSTLIKWKKGETSH